MVRNTIKTAMLLGSLGGALVLTGSLLAGRAGVVIGMALGFAFVGGSWWFSDVLAVRAAGARPVEPGELPWLRASVERLASRAGVPTPRLYLSPSPQPNAFATGRGPDHAVVAVTEGLLSLLEPAEIEAVLAHELAHVRHRDILLTSVAAAVATGISAVANLASFGLLFGGRDDHDGPNPLAVIAFALVAPLAAGLLQLALSRSRELDADRAGADLLGDGEPLARALERIDVYAHAVPMAIAPAQAQAWIVNPLARQDLVARLFSTHPPVAERTARLRQRTVAVRPPQAA